MLLIFKKFFAMRDEGDIYYGPIELNFDGFYPASKHPTTYSNPIVNAKYT
jgi:hypothetical protein